MPTPPTPPGTTPPAASPPGASASGTSASGTSAPGAPAPGASGPAAPSRALLYWIAIALLGAGLALALVAFLRRPDRVVLVPFDDGERGWYQARIAQFADQRRVRLSFVQYKTGEELRRLLAADDLERKGRVVAVLAPIEMLAPLAGEGSIVPLETVAEKDAAKLVEVFVKEAREPGRLQGTTSWVPDHITTLCLYYSIRRVEDLADHWESVRERVNADLRAWNGGGLPRGYQLERDPGAWDSYDVVVAATYWASHSFDGFTVPRIAHAADLEDGADADLASRAYAAGAANAELVALDGLGVRDAMAWESYLFAHDLYHPSMTSENWGRGEILSAIAQGQIYMAPLALDDLFRLHGTGDAGGEGLLRDSNDLGVTRLPQFMSLELQGGMPARTGPVAAARGGGWWGVPRTSPDRGTSKAFIEHVTSSEFLGARCRRFGVLPARIDLLDELDLVFPETWQFRLASAANRQAMKLGRTLPTSDRWLVARAGLVRAWREACVVRHEREPMELQKALAASTEPESAAAGP